MSLKPLRLLSTFCWYSLWGLRRPHVFFLFFWVLNCRKHLNPFPFWPQAAIWAPASPFSFSFVVLPCSDPAGSLQIPLAPSPQPRCARLHACSYSLHSKMWCFDFFLFLYCFCVFLFWIFSFPTKIMPRKNKFCMFPAVSSHLRIYHLHLSVFYSLCKNWPI